MAELEFRRAELEQANKALREANDEKAHILGVVAHDLRSGIGGMSGIAALLDMSRLEQGRLNLHLEIADLRGLVAESLAYHAHFAANKNQRLIGDRCDVALRCAFDPVRLRQVLDNLLSNAIKYSPPGAEIRVSQRAEGPLAVVEILDQGPGLTEADAAKVFRSFQKLSAQPTAGEDSHGLGLAIAKKVVESHHGTIWARNRTDQRGAAFGLSLAMRPGA